MDDKGINGFQRVGMGGKDKTRPSQREGKDAKIKTFEITTKVRQL